MDVQTTAFGATREASAIVAGLPGGTTILTREGERGVETLAPGDRIITRDSGLATLRALRVCEAEVALVRIRAGSLGHTRPERDSRLGPGTPVHIRDWRAQALYARPSAMVPALRLIDGEFVAAEPAARHRLYTLVFDRPHVVYADGLEIGA
jgi:hypothetical protein